MALARFQFTVQDEQGNVVPGAEVEVRREDTGVLPQLYSDRDGAEAKGNPFVADAEGFAFFHVVGSAYKITVTHGLEQQVWRYVAIGQAGETDGPQTGVPLPTFAAVGDLTIGASERGYRIKRDIPAAANIVVPTPSSRAGLPLTIADGDGSFEAHPQTVQFSVGVTARGASTLVLDSNWQVVTLYPQSDNTYLIG